LRILVTGLCTLHWGRLQFGNVGNYYIIEPLFRELHRVFPDGEITTTFQMTKEFIEKEKVKCLPIEWYYAWRENEIELAREEYEAVRKHKEVTTPYATYVRDCDLIINVSGDMWGDNAEHVGHGRFLVDLYKMGTAQLLGKKTVLFGGTPGPFTEEVTRKFAKLIFDNFDLVVNREPVSSRNLGEWGFCVDKVKDFACPAFLYQPELSQKKELQVDNILKDVKGERPLVGFTIGGFNMPVGPYDMWPREEWQYSCFAEAIEYIVNVLGGRVILISHTNGFTLPPNFELINGRDYPILNQLYEVVKKRGLIKNMEEVICIDKPYLPEMIKSIIGRFDLMVTGRVHASVAAISQCVPTVFITYEKSFIPSTKMYGFASLAGVGELVSEPGDKKDLLTKIDICYRNRNEIKQRLEKRIPEVKQLSRDAFDEMGRLV
jgi:colanic acid/amylovoran biosynthesis protein